MAANGRLPESAPPDMLEGANNRHKTISAAVETTTVTKLLANGKENMPREAGMLTVLLTVWFIGRCFSMVEPWRRGTCQMHR